MDSVAKVLVLVCLMPAALHGIEYETVDATNLKFAVVVYRHGDRTPVSAYPTDKYNESDWPQGFGQLTKLGMYHEWQVGQLLRKRYAGFLNSSYVRDEIYVRSTDIDRTLMSAQAALNGLYPPSADEEFRKGLEWQPIPVHTVPTTEDYLFREADCPRLTQWKNEYKISQPVLDMLEPYKQQLIDLHKYAGYSNYNFCKDSFGYFIGIRDTLLVEKLSHRTLPDWYTEEMRNFLDKMYVLYEYSHSRDILPRQLEGGPMLNEFLHNLLEYSKGAKDMRKRKLMMYSGHDTNILGLTEALDAYPNKTIGYSSMIVHELRQASPSSPFIVNTFARFGPEEQLQPLPIPGCPLDCPLDDLVKLTAKVVNTDPAKSCEVVIKCWILDAWAMQSTNNFRGKLYFCFLTFIVVITFVLTAYFCISLLREQYQRQRYKIASEAKHQEQQQRLGPYGQLPIMPKTASDKVYLV